MRQTILSAWLVALALCLHACQSPSGASSTEPKTQSDEAAAPSAVEPSLPPSSESRQVGTVAERMAREIDRLIPGMGAEDATERSAARRDFEALCNAAAAPGREAERLALCEQIGMRLTEGASREARVWMIRQLERIGREEVASVLGRLLHDADEMIRETARRALQLNPAEEVRGIIEAALAEAEDDGWRIALINVLGARRETASVPLLIKYVGHQNEAVAAATIAALGDIGGSAARAAVYRTWVNDQSPVRDHAEAALLRGAEQLLREGNASAAARLYKDIYGRCRTDAGYFAALEGLARSQGVGSLIMLIEHMKMDDPETALRAARLALEIPGDAISLTLSMILAELPTEVQAVLIEGFGDLGDATARAAVLNAVRSEQETIRLAALRALRKIGNSSDLSLLIEIAARGAGAIRDEARRTVALLPGANTDDELIKLYLPRGPVGARVEIIRACAARRTAGAVELLLDVIDETDDEVQIAAYEALGELLPADLLPKIAVRLAGALTAPVREAAEKAAVATAARESRPEARSAPFLAGLPGASGAAKASLVRVLGRLGGAEALHAVRAHYPNSEADVADAAVRALSDWPEPSVLDDLLLIAQTGQDPAHRVLAFRGYVRLVRQSSDRTAGERFRLLDQALSIAERAEEKKLALSALAGVRDIDALLLTEMSLGDAELRDEAALAMLSIAKSLAAEQPDAALAGVEKVRGAGASEAVKGQAKSAEEFIRRFADYATKWSVAGPFVQAGKDAAQLFEMVFAPETDGGSSEWAPLRITDESQPWLYDLTRIFEGGNRCVYVRTRLWVERAGPARLEIGSDDGVKVWLNGALVHSKMAIRPVTPGEDVVEVNLSQGWNALMLKIVQGGGGWGFAVGLSAPDRTRLPGLRYETD